MKIPAALLPALTLALTLGGCARQEAGTKTKEDIAFDAYPAALDEAALISQTKGRYRFHSKELMILDTATGKTYVVNDGKWILGPKFPEK